MICAYSFAHRSMASRRRCSNDLRPLRADRPTRGTRPTKSSRSRRLDIKHYWPPPSIWRPFGILTARRGIATVRFGVRSD